MALKIRLRQMGCNNNTVYRVVVADSRSPRDGKYLEAVGWYNPYEEELEKKLFVKIDRLQHWLGCGAQMSAKAETLLKQAAPEVIRDLRLRQQERRVRQAQKRRGKAAA